MKFYQLLFRDQIAKRGVEEALKTKHYFFRIWGFFVGIFEANAYQAVKYFHPDLLQELNIVDQRSFRRVLSICLMKNGFDTDTPEDEGELNRAEIAKLHQQVSFGKIIGRKHKDGTDGFNAIRQRCITCYSGHYTGISKHTMTAFFCSCLPNVGECDRCHQAHLLTLNDRS